MASYWFRPRRYGYGATPINWQGWAFAIATAGAIAAAALLILPHRGAANPAAWLAFFAVELVIIVAAVVVGRRKTAGEWRWRWGDR